MMGKVVSNAIVKSSFQVRRLGEMSDTIGRFKGVGKLYYLRRELVERWKNGLDKTWLNFKLKVPYVIAISGMDIYFIRVRNPREVSFEQVPDFYKKCVNPSKKIYEYDAILEKTEKREPREKSDIPKELMEKILKSIWFKVECEFCGKDVIGKNEEETVKNYHSHLDNDCKVVKIAKDIGMKDLRKLQQAFGKSGGGRSA